MPSSNALAAAAVPMSLAREYADGDELLFRLSDRMLPLMSVSRDAAPDRTSGNCLGTLLYALDRRSVLDSVNAYDDGDGDDDKPPPRWCCCRYLVVVVVVVLPVPYLSADDDDEAYMLTTNNRPDDATVV